MISEKKVCRRCVLHSRVPRISINEEGYCCYCDDDGKQAEPAGENLDIKEKMEELFADVKKQGRQYDALLLFSGGKDSTYLLKWARDEYNLRVLAFTMVYPIGKPLALKNIDDVSKKLNIETIKFRPDEEMYKKMMKYALLEGHRYNLGEEAGCEACSFLFRWVSMKIAMQMNIPIVLDGRDKNQSPIGPIFLTGEQFKNEMKDGKYPFGLMHNLFNDALGEEYKNTIYGTNYDDLKNKEFPTFIAPFTFVDYDYVNNFSEIEKLGLDSGNFKTLLTNCDAAYLFDCISYKKFDCPSYIKMYSAGLRNELPTVEQLSSSPEQPQIVKKEAMEQMLEEYKKVLFYVAEKNYTPENITEEEFQTLRNMAVISCDIYGRETADALIQRILSINSYAKYFSIDLVSIDNVEFKNEF